MISLTAFFSKLVLPASMLVIASFTTSPTPTHKKMSKHPLPDSVLSIPIHVLNNDRQPTVTVEREVSIPRGFVYLHHELALVGAFPMDGMEQSDTWITGPGNSWSVYTKLEPKGKQAERIVVTGNASPGPKNAEIGVKVMLLAELRKGRSSN